MNQLQGMLGDPSVVSIRGQCEEFSKRLNTFSRLLDEWLKVQKGWMHLEPIFTSEDIMHQMPLEGKYFG